MFLPERPVDRVGVDGGFGVHGILIFRDDGRVAGLTGGILQGVEQAARHGTNEDHTKYWVHEMP
jgi:hypothetical protein